MTNNPILIAIDRLWQHVVDLVAGKADKEYVDQQITATEQSTDGKLNTTLDEAKKYTDEELKDIVDAVTWGEF